MACEPTRPRDPASTRRAVLDAAEARFARGGYAGTTMRDVAAASGVSQPLIHHHFGSKDDLYAAVRRRVCESHLAAYPAPPVDPAHPLDLAAELASLFAFLKHNHALRRLLNWARLEGNPPTWPTRDDMPTRLVARIRQAQSLGQLRADLDPPYLAVLLIGLASSWLENRDFFLHLFPDSTPDDALYLAHATALLQRGLAPNPAPHADADQPARDSTEKAPTHRP